jgi:ferric-dicitrate binding protein FerR (iron transport regulator)
VKWAGIAASIILILSLYRFFNHSGARVVTDVVATTRGHAVRETTWMLVSNTGDSSMVLRLKDQSVVTLSPKATVRYVADFGDRATREIFLEGEAFFQVAKDKTKPFTVITELLSTTALGTSFRVHQEKSSCQVELRTGKVVVKARQLKMKGWKQDVFLVPGQRLNYELSTGVTAVSEFSESSQQKKAVTAGRSGIENNESVRFVFANAPLKEVFERLSRHFDRAIEYTVADLDGMFFTGAVLATDSLPGILNIIARMNGLNVTEKAEGFVVNKSK